MSADLGPDDLNDDGDKIASIQRWLNGTSGFPVEYAAVRTLKKHGFEADAGRFYRSPETGESHEADVVASLEGFGGPPHVFLVGECKHLPTEWVVLTRSRRVSELDLLGWTVGSPGVIEAMVSRATEALRRSARENSGIPKWLINTPEPHGSAIVAKPRKGSSPERSSPHEALTQVVAAARGIVSEYTKDLAIAWPVLIVRGSLYQADLTPSRDLEARAIDWQRVIWGGVSGRPTVVDVVVESYLDRYADEAYFGLKSMRSAISLGAGLE